MTAERAVHATSGFVVIACSAGPCRGMVADDLRAALEECVRRSAEGVLVVAGCTVGPTGCTLRPTGPVVVVQLCDVARRPVGGALRLGPVRTAEDVAAVRDWLDAGRFDATLLPARLTALQGAATRN